MLRDDLPFDPARGLHRARLRAPAGETWLTLPVRGVAPGVPASAIRLAPAETWAPRAMRGIEHAFEDAPFFERYRCDVARILFAGAPRFVDLSRAMFVFLLRELGAATQVALASSLTGDEIIPRWTPVDRHRSVSDAAALEILLWHGPAARILLRRGAPDAAAARRGLAYRPAATGL